MEYGIAFELFLVFVKRIIAAHLAGMVKTTTDGAKQAQRVRRALTLITRGCVHPVLESEGCYYVSSMSRETTVYLVSQGKCQCEDHQWKGRKCSHRIAAFFYAQATAELKSWAADVSQRTNEVLDRNHFVKFSSFESRDTFVRLAVEQRIASHVQVQRGEFLPDAQLLNVTREQVARLQALASTLGGSLPHATHPQELVVRH